MSENSLGYLDLGLTDDVEVWDGSVSYVNPGEYIVEVVQVDGGQSNAGGRKAVLHYEVKEAIGDLAEENKDQVGRTIIQSQSLDTSNPKSGKVVASRLKSIVTALGVELDKRGGFNADDLIGAQMACEVIADTYTKTDPVTQEKIERATIKVIRERHLDAIDGDEVEEKEEKKPRRRTRTRRTNSRAEA
jgi:hypothetical protein